MLPAEFNVGFALEEIRLADVKGDVEGVDDCMPFVCILEGTRRFILEVIGCVPVAKGAITDYAGADKRSAVFISSIE